MLAVISLPNGLIEIEFIEYNTLLFQTNFETQMQHTIQWHHNSYQASVRNLTSQNILKVYLYFC